MNCLYKTGPDDDILLKFVLDGAPLPDDIQQHLEECETCRQRLNRFAKVNHFFLSQLYRSQCPTSMQLGRYCVGDLPDKERSAIAAHILICPLCASEVADTRRFLAEVEPLPTHPYSLPDIVHGVLATLVVPQSQPVTRYDAPQAIWPRQYRASSIDLLLDLSYIEHTGHKLLGAITNVTAPGNLGAFAQVKTALYRVTTNGRPGHTDDSIPLMTTQIDDAGNFSFSAIPPGNYTLVVHLPSYDVIVEELPVASFLSS